LLWGGDFRHKNNPLLGYFTRFSSVGKVAEGTPNKALQPMPKSGAAEL
jgi:hypothetical protein